jgi:hypothetical protein
MSEFKFSCPVCGQNVLCDTVLAGTQLACPHCNNTIGVPSDFTKQPEVSAQPGIPPAWTGHNAAATVPQRTSGLAIASLICSLSSLVTCIGWLPGIICGHLAKSRLRRNATLKGGGLATAGLVIGYLILMLEAGTAAVNIARFSAAMKQGFDSARQDMATNNVMVSQTQSTSGSNDNQKAESVMPGANTANSPQPEWTSDISTASFPDHVASGTLHGFDFVVKAALFRSGEIRLNSANGMSLEIIHGLGASIEGQNYEVQSTDDNSANPHVKITWTEDGAVQSTTFSKGYGMKLQFDKAKNRKVSGKIYLCLPDDSKSCVAGTFEVRLPKPK